MTNTLGFGYNAGLLDGVKAAYGCRAIVTQDGSVDVVPDRTDTFGDKDRVKALLTWLDDEITDYPTGVSEKSAIGTTTPYKKALANASGMLKRGLLKTREARPVVLYQDGSGAIVANTNASAGYLYVAAYRYADLPDGCTTRGLDKVLASSATTPVI